MPTVLIESVSARRCGGCTACCDLLPVRDLAKPALHRCQHQRTGKGCAIYAQRPPSCQIFSCRWLLGEGTETMRRPDRVHYVVDVMPDFIEIEVPGKLEKDKIPVVQVWCDPKFPDAHRDPELRAMLDREEHIALIRFGSLEGFVLVPPSRGGGQWQEHRSNVKTSGRQHSVSEILDVTGEVE